MSKEVFVIIAVIFVLILIGLLVLSYRIIKNIFDNSVKNKMRYVIVTVLGLCSIVLFTYLMYAPACTNIVKIFPFLYETETADWVQIWLSGLALIASLVTAIAALDISMKQASKENFQLYSELKFAPISNSLNVTQITDMQEKMLYREIIENPFENDIRIFSFELENFLNSELQYNLVRFTVSDYPNISKQKIDPLAMDENNKEVYSNNDNNKSQLFFEQYIINGHTHINIILSRNNGESSDFDDRVFVIMNPKTFFPYNDKKKLKIELLFKLEASEEYTFIKDMMYRIVLTLENKTQTTENETKYKFLITEAKSKIE